MTRFRLYLASLFALIAAVTATHPTSAQTRVPMDATGEWLVVPVVADDDTLRFILDTGAMRSVVGERAARRLQLQPTRTLSVEGASGAAVVRGTTLRTFEFAGRTVRNLDVLILGDDIITPANAPGHGPYDGVLGADILARFDILISAPAGELIVFPAGTGAQLAAADLAQPIRFEGRGSFVFHDVDVGGTVLAAILDSGARHLVLNGRAREVPGLRLSTDSVRRASPGVGTDEATIRAGTLRSLAIGTTVFRDLPIHLADLRIFATLRLSDRPAALIGMPALRSCPVLVSWHERTVRYCRQPGASADARAATARSEPVMPQR